jgi:hypothetical protein
MQVMRKTALGIALQPVVVVECGADPQDGAADLFLVGVSLKVMCAFLAGAAPVGLTLI